MEGDREFATYLKDHLAGSTGGVSLAQRMADTAQDGTAGFQEGEARELAKIAEEIEADQETLLAIMDRLDVPPSRFKRAGAWIGEKLARSKLRASSPWGRVLQFESLIMGVTGKIKLWRCLYEVAGSDARLQKQEIKTLLDRAEDQRRRLETLHEDTAHSLG